MSTRSAKRWAIRLLALLLVAVISVGATWLWITLGERKPSIPLTADLQGKWAEQNKDFASRVKMQFPLGSPETGLASALASQGFEQVDWGGSTGTIHRAVRDESSIVCIITAEVTWQSDAQRRLTAIEGTYGERGCL